ncbi:hypothetical protein [Cellulomonas sp. PhB150]|uniref:hypothetical protein n=1 Tax=Cellulomonas sp. PhB150 TaxID=2485188 RepID=UPI000FC337EC|nr:hypothetical protein [Cellulomonas sp. PhB150]ROS30795.1 hypothetical protein EDF34_0438 [Cellulomonas sp. PhB150]
MTDFDTREAPSLQDTFPPRDQPASGGSDDSSDSSASDKLKGAASTASDAGASVLGEARSGAADVTQEAQRQARDLWDQTRSELADQTGDQQRRLASGVRSFASQLDEMASGPEQQGVATDLARQLGGRADTLGRWLEDHGPDEVLEEVRSFARRRPGTFLLVAAGAGLLVGRLTRALKDAPSEEPTTATTTQPTSQPTSNGYQP